MKTVLPLPLAVQRNVKLLKMEKVEKKKKVGKYDELEWQKDPPVQDMKKQQFIDTLGMLHAVQSTEPIDIFEMMITDELVEYIATQTNLYFKQNISGKIFKATSLVIRHLIKSDGELCNSIDIRLYIARAYSRHWGHECIFLGCIF